MNQQKFLAGLLILVFSVVMFSEKAKGQESDQNSSVSIYSVGVLLGWYNPSLDYWKEKSEFKDADFSGAVDVKGFFDVQFINCLNMRIGVEYWQTTATEDLQGFGNTKLLLTGIPITLDVLYYIKPIRFSVITPFIGAGGAYTFINYKLDFEQKDNPDPSKGSTFAGTGIAGLQAKLSEKFALDLEFDYKFGSYNQEFTKEIVNPENPEEPEFEIITETISLNGPFVGLTLKYLF